LQKASPEYTLLILSISSPLQVGVYRDATLIETIKSEKKISEALLTIIDELLKRYSFCRMIYTRGPGSYMAIKLTYIILKTIEIVRKIPVEGCSAFVCNDNRPIKAIGNLYFVREGEMIATRRFDQPVPQEFMLPVSLQELKIDRESIPDYSLPAV